MLFRSLIAAFIGLSSGWAAAECMKRQEGRHYLEISEEIVRAVKEAALSKMELLK